MNESIIIDVHLSSLIKENRKEGEKYIVEDEVINNSLIINPLDDQRKGAYILLRGCEIGSLVILEDVPYIIRFDHCTFNHIVNLKSDCLKQLMFYSCKISNLFIDDFKPDLVVWGCEIQDLIIGPKCPNDVRIGDMPFMDITEIETNNKKYGKKKAEVSRFAYKVSEKANPDAGKIFISSIHIELLEIEGINISEVVFENITNTKLKITNFLNTSKLRFYGVNDSFNSLAESLIINQSNMVNSELFRFNFSSYRKVVMLDSYITGMLFYNVTWKDPLLHISQHADKVEVKQIKESYRQLKHAAKNQMDRPQELKFYAEEMNLYYETISWNRKNFFDKMNIFLSRNISNYGQSFGRPLLIWIGLNYVLYFWFICSLDQSLTVPDSVNEFYFEAGKYFSLMNPLRKYDNKVYLTDWGLDMISRTVSAYFVFLLLKFVRKYINK